MRYTSDIKDKAWEQVEPILIEALSEIKKTRPLKWGYREILNGILYQLKNGCNWENLPKDLPPYSTVYWYYKQWIKLGIIEKLNRILHEKVREAQKKHQTKRFNC